ncbi:MAG: hypothetical protein GY953_44010, partial [bacterium]|nr:hypothetical protein [bacterium]
MTASDHEGEPALYVAGNFYGAGEVSVNNIAKWDGAEWTPMGTGIFGLLRSSTVYDDGGGAALFAVGTSETAGDEIAIRIAKWDGETWTMPSGAVGGDGLSGDVRAFAVYDDGSGSALYAGGHFAIAGGGLASRIAKWDGAEWTPLGTGLNNLNALAVYNDGGGPALYAGGYFQIAGGMSASNIAKWDGVEWAPLGAGVNERVY